MGELGVGEAGVDDDKDAMGCDGIEKEGSVAIMIFLDWIGLDWIWI